MDGLSHALRPAVLCDNDRGALRHLPEGHRPDRSGWLRGRNRLRGAGTSPAGVHAQEHDAGLRARGCAAACGIGGSGMAVWRRIVALRALLNPIARDHIKVDLDTEPRTVRDVETAVSRDHDIA